MERAPLAADEGSGPGYSAPQSCSKDKWKDLCPTVGEDHSPVAAANTRGQAQAGLIQQLIEVLWFCTAMLSVLSRGCRLIPTPLSFPWEMLMLEVRSSESPRFYLW